MQLEQRLRHLDALLRAAVVASRDQIGQLLRGGQVGRDHDRVNTEHLADRSPPVVVVLGLFVVDPDAQFSQRVDDDCRE